MAKPDAGRSMIGVALGNVALPLAAFASAPLLAYGLGVSGRGELAGATSLLLLFTVLGTIGLPEAVAYFVATNAGRGGGVTRHAAWMLVMSGAISEALPMTTMTRLSAVGK